MAEIRKVTGELIDRGHAYVTEDGHVFFDVSTYAKFGEISHYDQATMLRYAKERGGNPDDKRKRNPLDFVLWQPSAEGEPAWESLWGAGRPGWHIECTALARRDLGEDTIDLHGGGADLIFPHHECSNAQSACLTGKPLARHWMHQAMVRMDGEKMSKSLGNLVFVSELRKTFDPMAIRLLLVAEHYRTSWEWHDKRMPEAVARLERWVEAGDGDGALNEVRAALDNDLDTPAAVAAIDRAAAAAQGRLTSGCATRCGDLAASRTALVSVERSAAAGWNLSRCFAAGWADPDWPRRVLPRAGAGRSPDWP